jgi:hypothetical protein
MDFACCQLVAVVAASYGYSESHLHFIHDEDVVRSRFDPDRILCLH